MGKVAAEIGKNIRTFRKMRHLTLEELSSQLYKSKSTLSKYEKGEIIIDVESLYDIADVLNVDVEQLMYYPPVKTDSQVLARSPAFFSDISRFYSYIFDGRENHIICSVLDILQRNEDGRYKVMMYMNYRDQDDYRKCENTYRGRMEHFDAVTNISLTNQDMPMEKASIQILASFLESETKWGLWNGFSSRPMMPIAMKMLFSRHPLRPDAELEKHLKVSKEDIRLLRLYNMLSVM